MMSDIKLLERVATLRDSALDAAEMLDDPTSNGPSSKELAHLLRELVRVVEQLT